ncbi:unnamed protein product [Adineta ricciae]|uniref:Uncharacterized protein n=1 Tax=Adineta ricciae TaxID=249248 RepID=A0A815VB27_ADIRI|nr:unnamed protein product [Adineta ricciae]
MYNPKTSLLFHIPSFCSTKLLCDLMQNNNQMRSDTALWSSTSCQYYCHQVNVNEIFIASSNGSYIS